MFGLLDYLKIGAGAALGAFLAVLPAYYYGKHEGRQQAAVAALTATVKATKDRTNENDTIKALDAYGLCVELGGLPDDCEISLHRPQGSQLEQAPSRARCDSEQSPGERH